MNNPYAPTCEGMYGEPCAEAGPPMELAHVIWTCDCHGTLEEDAPAVYVAAPDMLAALLEITKNVDSYRRLRLSGETTMEAIDRAARAAIAKAQP